MKTGVFSPLMSPETPLNKSTSLNCYEFGRDTVLQTVAFWHGLRNDRLAKAQTHFQVPGQTNHKKESSEVAKKRWSRAHRLRLIEYRAGVDAFLIAVYYRRGDLASKHGP